MKKNSFIASLASMIIPGLGQMYLGQSIRGAAILIAVIVVGNLNAIWLSTYAISVRLLDSTEFWGEILPRVLHDLFALYGLAFIIWQIVDAYRLSIYFQERKDDS